VICGFGSCSIYKQASLSAGTATDVADLFIGSLIHSWLVEALFLGDDRIPSNGEIREKAERIVERFLASASS